MEGLQFAQVVADLDSLNVAESGPASALVNANKNLGSPVPARSPQVFSPHAQSAAFSPGLPTASQSQPNKPARLDFTDGHRNSTPSPFYELFQRLASPPMTRSSSATNSIPGTPARDSDDDDLDRTSAMTGFHDLRAKLRHQDNLALMRARTKVAEVAERQRLHAVATAAGLDRDSKGSNLASLIKSPRQQ